MTARMLDGRRVADALVEEVGREVASLARPPGLAVVLVGDDPASAVYVRNKTRAAEKAGIRSLVRQLPASASTEDLLAVVGELNADDEVHGLLVQLPLPDAVDRERVLDAIDPRKDVDAFHPENVGRLVQGRPRFVPCTPAGIMECLRRHDIPLRGTRAVVVGRSEIVGKPMATLLLAAHATVTICHSRTRDLPAVTREADLLVAAVGKKAMITGEHVRPGAAVVDVGIHRVEEEAEARALFGDGSDRLRRFLEKGKALVGDVHPQVAEVAGWLTPVPGGVGPLTVAMLLRSTLAAARG